MAVIIRYILNSLNKEMWLQMLIMWFNLKIDYTDIYVSNIY